MEATTAAAESFREVHHRAVVLAGTAEGRATRLLDRLQHEAEADIEAAQEAPQAPSRNSIDEAAEAKARFRAHADKVTAEIQTLTERRCAIVADQSAPWWRRRSKLMDSKSRIAEIDEERAILIARRAVWSTGFIDAGARHQRAVQAYKSEVATAQAEAKETIEKASKAMSGISYARQMLHIWPALAHCGSASCHRAGERIAKAAQGLRDPWAVTIWGLPIRGPQA